MRDTSITTGAIIAVLLLLLLLIQLADAGSCSSSSTLYQCPNCGGIEVKDCLLDCPGFLSTDNAHNMCFDRKLFQAYNVDLTDHSDHYHFLWNDLVGAIVWFVMAGVATACGVGGGGIYVPLGILLLQFSPKQASGLSQASIFGASLGGLLLNSRNRHPVTNIRSDAGAVVEGKEHALQVVQNKAYEEHYVAQGKKLYTRPLINFDMALFLSPMEMAGAVLGVIIQRLLPNWLYLIIASVVLGFTAYKTYTKYFEVHKKEKEQKEKEHQAQAESSNEDQEQANKETCRVESAVSVGKGHVGGGEAGKSEVDLEAIDTKEEDAASTTPEQPQKGEEQRLREKYLEDDMRQYPREKVLALVILWIGLLLLTLFKGGKGVESLVGITCESPWYIVLIVLQFLWMFGFAIVFGLQLVKKQAARVKVHYPYLPDDPVWDMKALRFYSGFTFIAGIVAGLIGIGGGMVLGPLMLIMGINPRVSSATTATMIVLTSSSVAVIFVFNGLVPWSYAVFYFLICMAGAILGKSKIDGYIKRTGRASLLILILATIIAFATIGVLVIMFTRLADKGWCLDGFNKFCSVSTSDNSCPVDRLLESLIHGSAKTYFN